LYYPKFDEVVKSRNSIEFAIPAKPETSYFKQFWTPAFAGVTIQETFYEIINYNKPIKNSSTKYAYFITL